MNLKEQRNAKVTAQMAIINKAKSEQRDLTAEEQEQLDSLQRDIDDLTAKIEAEERAAQAGAQADAQVEAETARALEITTLCRDFGMDASIYIKDKVSVDEVRSIIIKKQQEAMTPVPQRGTADVTVTATEEDKFRSAAVDGLLMRGGLTLANPAEGAKQFSGLSLRDLAITCLEKEGRRGLNMSSSDEIFNDLQRQFMSPTSAFASIADAAINKAIVEGHKSVNATFDKFVKKGRLSDFKTHDNNYLMGPAGEFLEVPEGGELKQDKPSDDKMPARKLKTYGRQFSMTRQAFINDDIDFLSKLPAKYAAAARKTQNKQVYEILCNNPAVYDGKQLFSTNHKNVLATGTGVTAAALQNMIMALQTQVDQFGEAIIVNPATLVVPSGYAFEVYSMLFSPTINTAGNTQAVNPLYKYNQMIEVVEDPTINVLCGGFGNVMPWFLIGNKNDTDFIQVDYLNGQEVPTIQKSAVAGQLGLVWDVYLDWGITVMDYRGAVKNPGIQIDSPLA